MKPLTVEWQGITYLADVNALIIYSLALIFLAVCVQRACRFIAVSGLGSFRRDDLDHQGVFTQNRRHQYARYLARPVG